MREASLPYRDMGSGEEAEEIDWQARGAAAAPLCAAVQVRGRAGDGRA